MEVNHIRLHIYRLCDVPNYAYSKMLVIPKVIYGE